MSDFERGFAAGESAAFNDRRAGRTRCAPIGDMAEYTRGFWAGYTPRNPVWALTSQPVRPYCEAGEE
jgi:hypothetical protein